MHAKVEKREVVINLVLNEDEAKWLRDVMRNPITHDVKKVEGNTELGLRKEFFVELDAALKNNP